MPLLEPQTCFIVTFIFYRYLYHVKIPIFAAFTMTRYLVDVTDILLLSFVSWDDPSHLAKETESQVSWLAQGHTVKGTGIQTSTVIRYSVAFHSVSITSFWDPLPGYLSLASSAISSIFHRQSGRGSPHSQI